MKIKLTDIVEDTYTNNSGDILLTFLKGKIDNKEFFELSFEGASPMSSSFYNSSIGNLIEEYSLETVKKHIKFVSLNKSQYNLLLKYINSTNIPA